MGENMNLVVKAFSELSASEVYEITKSRAKIFMLEQNIICLDQDDVDYISLHCFFTDGKKVTAYLRAFASQDDPRSVTVGRVLTLEHSKGIGTELMKKSIPEIKKHFGRDKITVHAQIGAVRFYEKLGFSTVSDKFIEAGIPHVIMEIEL